MRWLGISLVACMSACQCLDVKAELECNVPQDCRADLTCVSGHCVSKDGGRSLDAGVFDAGLDDAGAIDAGTVDAGALDAGIPDAGAPDAGHDAGVFDAGPLPTFVVDVEAPPMRSSSTATFTENDSRDAGAWRRDEMAHLRVSGPVLDGGVVDVALLGIGDGGPSSVVLQSTDCLTSLACDDAGFCACFIADLSKPAFGAVRGDLGLQVKWTSPAGYESVQSSRSDPAHVPPVPVTRVRWRYLRVVSGWDINGPALDSAGNILLSVTGEAVVSLSPAGTTRFVIEDNPGGSVVVGGHDAGGPERVSAVRSALRTDMVLAFDAADGGVLPTSCSHEPLGADSATPTLIYDPDEQLAATALGEDLVFVERWASCVQVNASGGYGSTAGDGPHFFSAAPSIEVDFDAQSWQTLPSTDGLAVITINHDVVEVGLTGLARWTMPDFVPYRYGPLSDWQFPLPTVPRWWGLVDGAGNIIVAGESPQSTPGLQRLHIGETDSTRFDIVQLSATPYAAGALAADKTIYAIGDDGTLTVVSPSFTTVWSDRISGGPAEVFKSSLNLDCARDSTGAKVAGRPGTLYAVSQSQALYSLIVDARGIDTTAAWPLWRHDPRNTGNSQTSLAEFECP